VLVTSSSDSYAPCFWYCKNMISPVVDQVCKADGFSNCVGSYEFTIGLKCFERYLQIGSTLKHVCPSRCDTGEGKSVERVRTQSHWPSLSYQPRIAGLPAELSSALGDPQQRGRTK
jgi:hypothetical protein